MSRPTPVAWLTSRGGVAHTRDLAAAGFDKIVIRRLVEHGDAERMRRSWIVLTGVDPARRVAARVGARVTCVSAARVLGLWAPRHDDVHVALPHGSSVKAASGLVIHRAVGPTPVARTATIDPVVNVLFHIARCLGAVDALAVWESALRRREVEPDMLSLIRWRCLAADSFARRASVLSDSGVETAFVVLVRSMGVAVRQQVWIDGHRVDGVIGDRLVVQIDGFAHHSDVRDRRRDIAADARLTLLGYTVMRFDYFQVLFQPDLVRTTIALAMAQGRHRRPSAA